MEYPVIKDVVVICKHYRASAHESSEAVFYGTIFYIIPVHLSFSDKDTTCSFEPIR